MKRIILMLALLATSLHAEKFAWDNPNPAGEVKHYVFQFLQPDAEGNLAWVTAALVEDDPSTTVLDPPTEVTVPIPAGATKARVAAVGINNLQSNYSNELGVIRVAAPANLRVVIELELSTP